MIDLDFNFYRNLFLKMPQSIVILRDSKIIYANNSAARMACVEKPEMLSGVPIVNFISADRKDSLIAWIDEIMRENRINWAELPIVTPDAVEKVIEVTGSKINYMEEPSVLLIFRDITLRKSVVNALKEAEAKYRTLVEGALVGVYIYQDNKFVYANPKMIKDFGYPLEELTSRNILDDIIVPEYLQQFKQTYKNLLSGLKVNSFRFKLVKKDGCIADVEVTASSITIDGKTAIIGTVLDITERIKSEEKITHMAYYDALTGLPNRYLLNDHLTKLIKESSNKPTNVGVMFIDLDRFKLINDTMGHSFGDRILKLAAERLKACVRKSDIISRYGGDEFVIILENADKKDITQVAQRIIDEFSHSFILDGFEVFTSPSIGISIYPADAPNTELLVRNADMAMYLAKEQGRNNYQFYKETLNSDLSRKVNLEIRLRKALENNEFVLYYQPKIDSTTKKITGIEALIRWQHPRLGLIPPSEFIPLAEESSLIHQINEWVLRTALKQIKTWQNEGYPPIKVSVNISGRQSIQQSLADVVSKVLKETDVDPELLEIEIAENMIQNVELIIPVLNKLKDLGVKISIDDFGTGYSSLSYVMRLPIDTIKIDKSFVNGLGENEKSEAIAIAIITLGNNLNLRLVAEGVETGTQFDFLKKQNCHEIQGYFFSKPLPASDIVKKYLKPADNNSADLVHTSLSDF